MNQISGSRQVRLDLPLLLIHRCSVKEIILLGGGRIAGAPMTVGEAGRGARRHAGPTPFGRLEEEPLALKPEPMPLRR